ncbi:hypothetical protein pb186bvf_001117 [Paramecium bursaria]
MLQGLLQGKIIAQVNVKELGSNNMEQTMFERRTTKLYDQKAQKNPLDLVQMKILLPQFQCGINQETEYEIARLLKTDFSQAIQQIGNVDSAYIKSIKDQSALVRQQYGA